MPELSITVSISRVRGWRGTRRVRCLDSTRFRGGAQSGSHRSVSTPCPPNRTCGFPASGSPVGSCLSHAERRCGSRSRYRRLCVPPAARSCTASPARCPLPSRRRACSRPGGTRPTRPGPFAYACDASQLSAPSCGVRRQCHSRGLSFLRHLSTPEAPFLGGRYPASPVLRASPPPCRPGLPLAGSRLPRARHRQGFPCCCTFHLPCMPTPLPRRKPAGARVALFPAGRRPSPVSRRVGSRINRFEACSAFTRVPACMVAEPPKAARLPECFSPCRYLHEPPWLLPAGATVAGWDSHPPGKRAFPRRTGNPALHSDSSPATGGWYSGSREGTPRMSTSSTTIRGRGGW